METKKPTFLPKSWDLPEAIRVRLGDTAGRQRLMDAAGHLLLILHHAPSPEDHEIRKPALFWNHPTGDWKSFPEPGGLAALDAHLDAYRQAIVSLDEAVEKATTPRDYFEAMKRLNPLLRSTRNLHAVLQEAREKRPDERRLINLRDRAVDLERAIDLLAGDAKAGMEFSLAENAEEQSRFAHEAAMEARKLNRLAALFFPLATLAAVFGINPPSEVLASPGAWTVIGAGVIAGWIFAKLPSGKR